MTSPYIPPYFVIYHIKSLFSNSKKKEFWTGIVAAVVIIGTSVFCPPAGLALATVYGGLEAGTAIVGKDWLTGRKLDNQERTIRGMFSALDLIPGLKAFTGGTNLWQASLKGSKMAGMTVKQAGTIARESAASRIRRLGDLAAQTKQAAKNTTSRSGTSLQNGIKKIGRTKVPFQPKSSYAAAGGGHIADEGRTIKDALQQFAKDNPKLNFGGKGGIIEGADKCFTPKKVTLENGEIAYKAKDGALVRSPKYLDEVGNIKWPEADGFVVDKAGKPITVDAKLKAGQIIDRYGDPFGKFMSPVENGKILAYDTRGLPYPESAKAYHQYEVVKDINMENVQKAYKNLIPPDKAKLIEDMDFYKFSLENIANPQLGKISKVFGSGGGTQVQLGTVVRWYEKLGLLKEIK